MGNSDLASPSGTGPSPSVEPVSVSPLRASVPDVKIKKRWRVTQTLEKDPYAKTVPLWASHLVFGTYREQGWAAFDQRQRGKTVATGEWGDQLFLLKNGEIACTRYPQGYRAAYPWYFEDVA